MSSNLTNTQISTFFNGVEECLRDLNKRINTIHMGAPKAYQDLKKIGLCGLDERYITQEILYWFMHSDVKDFVVRREYLVGKKSIDLSIYGISPLLQIEKQMKPDAFVELKIVKEMKKEGPLDLKTHKKLQKIPVQDDIQKLCDLIIDSEHRFFVLLLYFADTLSTTAAAGRSNSVLGQNTKESHIGTYHQRKIYTSCVNLKEPDSICCITLAEIKG